MKRINLLLLAFLSIFISCESVAPGHSGVKVAYGGKTDMSKVYDEGLKTGFHWVYDKMIEYDCREQVIVLKEQFLDYDGLDTDVEVILYFSPDPAQVNLLHTKIGRDYQERILGIFKSAVKTAVAQHQALKLNREERDIAEATMSKILEPKLAEIYNIFKRVEITDVDLPDKISNMIVLAKEQDERNNLAEKKELEATLLAEAEIARAKGEYEAATYDAKTKEILSQPKMLELKRIENETIMWQGYAKTGNSPYGTNNVFGEGAFVLKNLK